MTKKAKRINNTEFPALRQNNFRGNHNEELLTKRFAPKQLTEKTIEASLGNY